MRQHLIGYKCAALLAVVCSLLATSQASASLLLAPTWVATGSPIVANDIYNLGVVVPGTPASIGVDFINVLRPMAVSTVILNGLSGDDFYRSDNALSLPVALTEDFLVENDPNNEQTLTANYDYMSAKYGTSGFIIWRTDAAFWALADNNDGTYTITVPLHFDGKRVSNIRGYNGYSNVIPEPGSLIAWSLLGGIGLIASKRRRHGK